MYKSFKHVAPVAAAAAVNVTAKRTAAATGSKWAPKYGKAAAAAPAASTPPPQTSAQQVYDFPDPADFEEEFAASSSPSSYSGGGGKGSSFPSAAAPAAATPTVELQLTGGEGMFGKTVTIPGEANIDLELNFQNISAEPFPKEVAAILMAPVEPNDVEIKPDGLIYLPEIKYRRVLLKAFGPGGWGMVPRSQHSIEGDTLSREYALFAFGRFVAQARGEQQYFKGQSLATASEGAKSNALMRCCKDLGIAGELWDPNFILQWRTKYAVSPWCEHEKNKTKQKLWRRIDRPAHSYPWKESK